MKVGYRKFGVKAKRRDGTVSGHRRQTQEV